jgi:CheY-like chemotaxis protein
MRRPHRKESLIEGVLTMTQLPRAPSTHDRYLHKDMSDPITPAFALACLPWIEPFLLDDSFPERTRNAGRPTLKEQQPGRTAHILTASATLREMLTRCLQALDMAVTGANGQPDLLLLDLAAPDALAHCRTLRERDFDLPIVALIAHKADQFAAWEAGANAVLPVPFDLLDLHATIGILLGEDDA